MTQLLYGDVSEGEKLQTLAIDITTTAVIAGALASRDYSPLHHDYHYVTTEAGHRDIFLNTPHQASLFERFLGDWSGPRGRLGRMRFSMRASVYAGDRAVLDGRVLEKSMDELGCAWVKLQLSIAVAGQIATECAARYALPVSAEDNPWLRRAEAWLP